MKKKIEMKSILAIVVSVIIGVAATLVLNFNSSMFRIAFTESNPTQEEYEVLKEYALEVVDGKYEEVKDVRIEKIFGEDFLKVKVERSELYGIESDFPIFTVKDMEIENGVIKYEADIDSENVTFSEYTLIKGKPHLIFADLLLITLFGLGFYIVFYWSPKEWKRAKKR